jgi:DNA-binding CsgD family transcriptional regulator
VISDAEQNNKILRLIECVYEAALDESRWRAFAPQMANTFGAMSAAVMVVEPDQRQVLSMTENISTALGTYQAHYWKTDVWIQRGSQSDLGRVRAGTDMIADSELEETEFYQDWLRGQDLFYMAGAICPIGQRALGVLGIHRSRAVGTYQENEKRRVSQFLPHLQLALQIRNRLAGSAFLQRVSIENLNRTDTAIVVVGADGHVIFATPRAEGLLAQGRALSVHKGRLTAAIQSDTVRLLSLIGSASNMGEVSNTPGGVMAVRQPKQLPLTVLVAPFRLALPGLAPPGAIVFIRDPNRTISAVASLQALFQLTPTEARIAQELANGKSLTEIAAAHRASVQTVRKQLKAIFAKTGTNRQTQCVTAILRSVAAIARD